MFLRTLLLTTLPPAFLLQSASAENLFRAWEQQAQRVQSQEPHWATPLITNTPVLDQSLRADFRHATEKNNATLWNLDSSKGLKVIVAPRTEIDFNLPPYQIYNNRTHDGFGDLSWALKYRFLSRDPAHGNALITGILQATYPTGSYSNGSANATVTPLLGGGKGWGHFDVISTFGATLPTAGVRTAGRSISSNTAAQYAASQHWWLELEDNYSYQSGGKNDGQIQNFLTPALISRWRNTSRRGFTLSAGMQFATSRNHSLDHNLILSGRLHF